MVLLLIKTYFKMYFIDEDRRKVFIIKLLILILISFVILSYLQFTKSIILGHFSFDINISVLIKSIYLTIILTWFSIGFFKQIDYSELIPYLNLPISRNALLLLFILRSYFGFLFLFILIINVLIILFIMNLMDVRFLTLVYLLLIYSIIPQQVGMLIGILKITFIEKFAIVLFMIALILTGYKTNLYINVVLIKALPVYLIMLFGGMIQITKIQLSKRIIDYL